MMPAVVKDVPRPTASEMHAAKEELRALERTREVDGLSDKDRRRVAHLEDVVDRHFAPEDAEEAPTLEELRAEREALEASVVERKRAEAASHRDRALADWEGRRQRFRDELDRHLNGLAESLFRQGPSDPAGLADLYEAVSDRFDKEMRARVLAAAERWRVPDRPHEVKRLQVLQREIAALEEASPPAPDGPVNDTKED